MDYSNMLTYTSMSNSEVSNTADNPGADIWVNQLRVFYIPGMHQCISWTLVLADIRLVGSHKPLENNDDIFCW